MAHLSENVKRLEYKFKGTSLIQDVCDNDAWFINLPYYVNKQKFYFLNH